MLLLWSLLVFATTAPDTGHLGYCTSAGEDTLLWLAVAGCLYSLHCHCPVRAHRQPQRPRVIHSQQLLSRYTLLRLGLVYAILVLSQPWFLSAQSMCSSI